MRTMLVFYTVQHEYIFFFSACNSETKLPRIKSWLQELLAFPANYLASPCLNFILYKMKTMVYSL